MYLMYFCRYWMMVVLPIAQGRTVDFKNTILIMTSNIGSPYLLDGIDENGEIKEEAQKEVMDDLRGHFRPEFLNRLDEIILFKPLTKDNIGSIVDLMVKELNDRLADQELSLELTDAAKKDVIDNGYDPVYGARPLKRYLQKICRDTDCQKKSFPAKSIPAIHWYWMWRMESMWLK